MPDPIKRDMSPSQSPPRRGFGGSLRGSAPITVSDAARHAQGRGAPRTTVTPSNFIATMRGFLGAVNIVTTADGPAWAGLTATAVCSLSAEPPRLLCCINQKGVTMNAIRSTGIFCVNVLARGHEDVAKRFAGMGDIAGEDRFAEGQWEPLLTGAPSLADAVMSLDCALDEIVDYKTHAIVIGEVRAIRQKDGSEPLAWVNGNFAHVVNSIEPRT